MYLWNLVSTISYAGCVFNFLWPLTIKGTPRDSDSSEVVQFNPAGSTQPVSYQPKANFTITPNRNYNMELKQLDSHQMSILQDYNEKKFDAVSSY